VNASIIGQSVSTPESGEAAEATAGSVPTPAPKPEPAVEIGGRGGPEPTRYGDWEKNGRCIDF
jgi:hypothetical protein